MSAKIINKGRTFVQHGDNVITLSNNMSTSNFLSICTIHLPRLFDMDVTTRGPGHSPGNTGAPSSASGNMTITTRPSSNSVTGTNTRLLVRLHGGYGYTSGGGLFSVLVERFDDITNLQISRANLPVTRENTVAFSINGFGFSSLGDDGFTIRSDTNRFDEAIDTWTQRVSATPRYGAAGYTINGFGFASCGNTTFGPATQTGITEKFDDITNSWETRASATVRNSLAGFGMNNFGFVSCGEAPSGTNTGIVERFDDSANNWTTRAPATPRHGLIGYALNGFGFTSCGSTGGTAQNSGITERLDDVVNTQTTRTSVTLGRRGLAGFSLNGFGFTSCGEDPTGVNVGNTQRFDDIANSQTDVTFATARRALVGYSTNEYFVNYRCYNE
jgi:hypothetical protein